MSFPTKLKTAVRTEKRAARPSPYIEYRNVDPAVETALYYGFTPLPSPLIITRDDCEKARALGDEEKSHPFSISPSLEEKAALLRYYEEKKWGDGPQPAMFCAEFLSGTPARKRPDECRLALEIVGSEKSIAEATLIQTAVSMLREEGHADLTVFLNSVGDRECMNRFLRELAAFYRKHVGSLPPSCRSLLRKHPIDVLTCEHEKCRALAEGAPTSIGCLGDESRRHFREVLEFLEELELPYRIAHTQTGNRAFATETIFEIRETPPGETSRTLASGMRYNNLGRRLGLRREVSSIGVNILLERSGRERAAARRVRFKRPSVFFLQLGFCAKLKSLKVIELLRQARIAVYQALNRDKLITQVSSAENAKAPYAIILGQREALENSVIVRNTTTRSQETVKIADLPQYAKKLKLG